MNSPVEKDVPSTSPCILRASLGLLGLFSPFMLWSLINGIMNGNAEQMLLGAYVTTIGGLCAYLIGRAICNPDRLHIDDQGFTYKFLNMTFRVGWEDVKQIELVDSKFIQIRLHDSQKVAFSILVSAAPFAGRPRYNPYNWIGGRRLLQIKWPWPENSIELAG